jgi:hypothetical protein
MPRGGSKPGERRGGRAKGYLSLVWRLDSPEMVGALTQDRDAPAFELGGGRFPLGDGAGLRVSCVISATPRTF